jgi:hypothetical protein
MREKRPIGIAVTASKLSQLFVMNGTIYYLRTKASADGSKQLNIPYFLHAQTHSQSYKEHLRLVFKDIQERERV